MKNNKLKVLLPLSLSIVAVLGVCASIVNKSYNTVKSESVPYVLEIANLTDSATSGQATVKTSKGNDVKINFDGLTGGEGILVNNGSTIEIDLSTPVSSIKSVEFCDCGAYVDIDIETGFEYDGSITYYNLKEITDYMNAASISRDIDDNPNYMKLSFENTSSFSAIKITYSCAPHSNPYAYDTTGDYLCKINSDGDSYTLVDYIGTDTVLTLPSTVNGLPVTEIYDGFLYNNKIVTSVTIPSNYKSIGYNSFYACNFLSTLNLSEGLESIGQNVCEYCYGLESISIPDSVTMISSAAFMCCTNLKTVTINATSKLTYLYSAAFRKTGISTFFVPKTVKVMTADLIYCSNLTEIVVDPENTIVKSIDGILYDYDVETLLRYPEGKVGDTYIMPNTVTEVNNYAMDNCPVKHLTLSSSLEVFGDYQDFNYLESIDWNNAPLTELNSYTLCGNQIEDLYIPEGIKYIGFRVFSDSSSVSIHLPSTIEGIGETAFYNCDDLTNLYFNGTVAEFGEVTISDTAFTGCTSLTCVTCTDGNFTL